LSSTSSTYEGIPQAGRGPYWQELQVGAKIKTFGRTVTEADLVNFISCTGMLEHTFIDATHRGVMSAATEMGKTATSATKPARGASSSSACRSANSASRPVTKSRRGRSDPTPSPTIASRAGPSIRRG